MGAVLGVLRLRLARIAFLTILLLAVNQVSAGGPLPDRWFTADKLKHFVFSAHLTLLSYKVVLDSYHNTPASSRAVSFGMVLSLGLSKEAWDNQKPKDKFSYKDLVADGCGIGLGLILGHNLK